MAGLEDAYVLLKAGKIQDARAIVRQIDSPKARKLLVRIDNHLARKNSDAQWDYKARERKQYKPAVRLPYQRDVFPHLPTKPDYDRIFESARIPAIPDPLPPTQNRQNRSQFSIIALAIIIVNLLFWALVGAIIAPNFGVPSWAAMVILLGAIAVYLFVQWVAYLFYWWTLAALWTALTGLAIVLLLGASR